MRRRIVGYKFICERSETALTSQIAIKLDKGWEPWGSPVIGKSSDYTNYCQAVVRYEDEPEPPELLMGVDYQ